MMKTLCAFGTRQWAAECRPHTEVPSHFPGDTFDHQAGETPISGPRTLITTRFHWHHYRSVEDVDEYRTVAQPDPAPKVLVVEDDRRLADLYAASLASNYDVRTAYTGEAALDALDFDPDIVLLDRRLPDMSGVDVVEAIQERKLDACIAMVTAADPDFDIIDLGIDDYLVKPVAECELEATVETLLDTQTLQEKKRALSSKQVKRNVLAVEKSPEALAESEDFRRLETRIETLETEIARLEAGTGSQNRIETLAGGD